MNFCLNFTACQWPTACLGSMIHALCDRAIFIHQYQSSINSISLYQYTPFHNRKRWATNVLTNLTFESNFNQYFFYIYILQPISHKFKRNFNSKLRSAINIRQISPEENFGKRENHLSFQHSSAISPQGTRDSRLECLEQREQQFRIARRPFPYTQRSIAILPTCLPTPTLVNYRSISKH